MFIIAYTCNNSGRRGQVTSITYDTKEEAQEICDGLNEEYPNITHYPTPLLNEAIGVKKVSACSK